MLNRWVLSRDRKTATEGADVTFTETNRQTYRQTYRHTYKQTQRQTYRETDVQTEANYTVSQKKLCQCYFVNNSVKHWPNLIIFGMQHGKET